MFQWLPWKYDVKGKSDYINIHNARVKVLILSLKVQELRAEFVKLVHKVKVFCFEVLHFC